MNRYWKLDPGFVLQLNVNKDDAEQKTTDFETIIIVDNSGSMGYETSRIVNEILHKVLTSLGYFPEDELKLILFHHEADIYNVTVDNLPDFNLPDQGGTSLAPAVECLSGIILSSDKNEIRILTISDGFIGDFDATMSAVDLLTERLHESPKSISSFVVRYFTGGEPDIRVLSSLMRINTTENDLMPSHVDCESSDDEIISELFSLLNKDFIMSCAEFETKTPIIKDLPWSDSGFKSKRSLRPGKKIIWLKEEPKDIMLSKNIIDVTKDDSEMELILSILPEIKYNVQRIKVLKIIDTQNSEEEIQKVFHFFDNLISILDTLCEHQTAVNVDCKLSERVEQIKRNALKNLKTFLLLRKEEANDDKVSKLNIKQQAAYLRNTDSSKLSKGLAKRAEKAGMDFTENAISDVQLMATHKSELDKVSSKDYKASFCSLATTLEGVQEVIKLAENNSINLLEVEDILEVVNFVGIAVEAPVGDFPDPKTWSINRIHSGVFASTSDIMLAAKSDSSNSLKVYNTEHSITSIIPIFESRELQKFLQKNAKHLLEYSASFGMRKMIAEVPMTYQFSIAAYIWKFVKIFNNHKLECDVDNFLIVLNNYSYSVGSYFDHIYDVLVDQPKEYSYNILNSRIIEMISVIYKLIQQNKSEQLPRIIRAIYSQEYFSRIKKKSMNEHLNPSEEIKKILKVNYDSYNKKLEPLFVEDLEVELHSDYHVDDSLLNTWMKHVKEVDFILLLIKIIQISFKKEAKKLLLDLPKFNAQDYISLIEVNNLDNFKLYNLVQGLMFTKQKDRYDANENRMLIKDVNFEGYGEAMIKKFVRDCYQSDYNKLLQKKKAKEREISIGILISKLCITNDYNEFKDFLENGYTHHGTIYKIDSVNCPEAVLLKEKLFDVYCIKNVDTVTIMKKLWAYLTGRDYEDKEKIVWNKGNCTERISSLSDFKFEFLKDNASEFAKQLQEWYEKHGVWKYRPTTGNKHGHGNDNPSYWALGYKLLEDMKTDYLKKGLKNEWEDYFQIHKGNKCCGIEPKTKRKKKRNTGQKEKFLKAN